MATGKYQSVLSTTVIANIPAAPTEGVIATTPPFEVPFDSQQILVLAQFGFTVGAAVTNILIRLRRGTLITSPAIDNGGVSQNVTAGAFGFFVVTAQDIPGIVAGVQYSVTGTNTGGAAVTVVSTATLIVALAL